MPNTADRTSALATARSLLAASNGGAPDQDELFVRFKELEDNVLFGGPPASSVEEMLVRIKHVRQREVLNDPMYREDFVALVNALEADLEHLSTQVQPHAT